MPELTPERRRELMERAVAAMHRSVQERGTKPGGHPLVGAVVLFSDGTVAEAARGEIRDGDHAEFTLLERKHPDRPFDDAMVFTTLEPCAGEHTRSERKTPCADRLVQGRISTVFIGIEDPDFRVAHKGIDLLEVAQIGIDGFDADLVEQIRKANHTWIERTVARSALSDNEVQSIDGAPLGRDAALMAGRGTVDELDAEALELFRRALDIADPINSDAFRMRLARQGWLGLNRRNVLVPTRFCMIFFGKHPSESYAGAVLQATIRYTDQGDPDDQSFETAALLIPDRLDAWLDEVLPRFTLPTARFRRKGYRETIRPWIREAVINAIMHRDYDDASAGAKIFLDITPSAITVKSPGMPPAGVTVAELDSLSAGSFSKNPLGGFAFRRIEAGEERNRGMEILRGIKALGLPDPRYTLEPPNYLKLTIPLSEAAATAASIEVLSLAAIRVLAPDEQRGLAILVERGPLAPAVYARAVGVGRTRAYEHYAKFDDERLATATGTTRDRKWLATPKAKANSRI